MENSTYIHCFFLVWTVNLYQTKIVSLNYNETSSVYQKTSDYHVIVKVHEFSRAMISLEGWKSSVWTRGKIHPG